MAGRAHRGQRPARSASAARKACELFELHAPARLAGGGRAVADDVAAAASSPRRPTRCGCTTGRWWPVLAGAFDEAVVVASGQVGGPRRRRPGRSSAILIAVVAALGGVHQVLGLAADRLHKRTETARAALDAALVRGSLVTQELPPCRPG